MSGFKLNWWVVLAGIMAVMQAFAGLGNLVEDDGGPLYGRVAFLAVLVAGAVLILAGIVVRQRNRRRGSLMIGIGVLPSASGILFFWFPPAVVYGIAAIVVAVVAFRDASGHPAPAEA